MEEYSDKKAEIDNQLKSSTSYDIYKALLKEMTGKTFHHHSHILYDLRSLLGNKEKVYLEIGSYCGASASLVIQHPYPTKVYCLDPLNLSPSHYLGNKPQLNVLRDNLEHFKCENDYEIFQAYSKDPVLLKEISSRGIKVDLLFIDGAHDRQAVLDDFHNYHNFVNSGGFIVFDDYHDIYHSPQVKIAVDEIVKEIEEKELSYEIIGSLKNYQNAFFTSSVNIEFLNEFILYKK